MDEIVIRGMRYFGFHGVLAEEQRIGQRFVVNLRLCLDLSEAGARDRLDSTVNYAEVYQKVKAVVEGEPVKLIETVAERIASILLADYTRLERVIVEVEKPGAPIQGVFDTVMVSLDRKR